MIWVEGGPVSVKKACMGEASWSRQMTKLSVCKDVYSLGRMVARFNLYKVYCGWGFLRN